MASEDPEDFGEALQEWAYENPDRILGASFVGAGTYFIIKDLVLMVKSGVASLTDTQSPTNQAVSFFLSVFSPLPASFISESLGIIGKTDVLGSQAQAEAALGINVDPFALSTALVAGGMVLAGQNPGEILKGMGAILDGLVPL